MNVYTMLLPKHETYVWHIIKNVFVRPAIDGTTLFASYWFTEQITNNRHYRKHQMRGVQACNLVQAIKFNDKDY